VSIASSVCLQDKHTWSALVHISHLLEQKKLCGSHFVMTLDSACLLATQHRLLTNLLIVYLLTLSVTKAIYHVMAGSLINDELQRIWKDGSQNLPGWSLAVAQILFSAKPRQSSRNLTTHLHHVPRLRTRGTIPARPQYVRAGQSTTGPCNYLRTRLKATGSCTFIKRRWWGWRLN
jgi:hypothetical protein